MASNLPGITARVDDKVQLLLQQATALSGIASVNTFVINAAVEKAKQIIEHERLLQLSLDDAQLLVEVLDREPVAHKRLQVAAKRYTQSG